MILYLAPLGLEWFKSHFILSDPSEPYFSRTNAWYWHHEVFLVPLLLFVQWSGVTNSKMGY